MQGFVMDLARRLETPGALLADDEADLLLQLALQEAGERFRPAGLSVQRLVRWKQEGHTVERVLETVADTERLDAQGIREVRRILKVWAAYEALKGAEYRDRGDLFQQVAAAVQTDPPSTDMPTIVLATHGLTAIDEQILIALARGSWEIGVSFAERLDVALRDRSQEAGGRLHLEGWELVEQDARTPAPVARYELPTPREEIRRIMGAIKEEVRNGTSPTEIAIVVPPDATYDTLIRDLGRQSGIPLDRTDVRSLSTTGDAAALYAAFQVVIRQWEREDLSRLSLSGQIRGDLGLTSLNEAADHFRVQGGSGVAAWRDRLRSSLTALNGLETEEGDDDDRSLRRTMAVLKTALKTLDDLESVLAPPSSSMSAETFEQYAKGLIDGLAIDATPEVVETLAWYRQICERHELAPRSLSDHCARWWAIVRGRTHEEAPSSGGVTVAGAADVRLGDYAVVFAPGFVHGVFPASRKDVIDEFFLSEADGTMDAEGLQDLLYAAHSDGMVVCTRAATKDDDDTLASIFWDDLGTWMDSGLLNKAEDRHEVFIAQDPPVLLSGDERRAWVDGAILDGTDHQRGLPAEVLPEAARSALDAKTSVALNPSRIDVARSCPYRYYGTRLLRLEQSMELDELLSPLERGNLMHSVAQAFFQGRQHQPLPESITMADVRAAQVDITSYPVNQLLPSLTEIFHRERERFPRGYLYEGAEERTFEDHGGRAGLLRRWLTREILDQQKTGFLPVAFELEIEDDVVLDANRTERLKIRVDRVDARVVDDHVELRVVDYKTASTPKNADIETGHSSQMPLYMVAVEQWFDRRGLPARVVDAAYHTFGKSLFAEKSPGAVIALSRERKGRGDEKGMVFDDLATTLPKVLPGIDRIRQQDFRVDPLDGACERCHLNELCRIEDWGTAPRTEHKGEE